MNWGGDGEQDVIGAWVEVPGFLRDFLHLGCPHDRKASSAAL